MKCILCRACQAHREALWRKFYADRYEQTNYRAVWAKEQDQERLDRAHGLWSSDPAMAYLEHRAMAEAGSVWAMTALGWAHETGTGTTADLVEAARWYELAFAAGSESALYGLGRVHRAAGALDELERVYALGVTRNLPQSMYGMAWLLMKRCAKKADRDKARGLLEAATANGDLEAKAHLAKLLMCGRFGWRAIPSGFAMFSSWLDEAAAAVGDAKTPTTESSEKTAPPILAARAATV